MSNVVYFLREYRWMEGKLLRTNQKTFTLEFQLSPWHAKEIRPIPKEKCAFPNEEVCIVWETWKGVNGHGGYRVERTKYPQARIPASLIPHLGDFSFNKNGRVQE